MQFFFSDQIDDAEAGKPFLFSAWQLTFFKDELRTVFIQRLQSTGPRCAGWQMENDGSFLPLSEPPAEQNWRWVPAKWARSYLRDFGLIPPSPSKLRSAKRGRNQASGGAKAPPLDTACLP